MQVAYWLEIRSFDSHSFSSDADADLREDRADTVTGRHEQSVAHHRRIGSVDGRPAHAEFQLRADRPGVGIEHDRFEPRLDDHVPHAIHRDGDGRGIAGVFVGHVPDGLASVERESDDPRSSFLPAHVHNDLIPLDDRRTPRAEIAFAYPKFGMRVASPEFLAIGQAHTGEVSLHAEGDHPVAVNDGHATGPIVRRDARDVGRGNRVLP